MQGNLPQLRHESPRSRKRRERIERQARERKELQEMVDSDPFNGRFSRETVSRRSVKPAQQPDYNSVQPTRESKIAAL